MAISSPTSTSLVILSSLLIIVLLSTPSTLADESNILLTGETIATDGQLSYQDASFVMQNDCNLVLYDKTGANGFASNTYAYGPNCTVTLNEYGQLLIRNAWGSTVWNSGLFANTTKGKYAAVLRPDGQVAVYGPTVWSSVPYSSSDTSVTAANANEAVAANNVPIVKNVLFSSQVLNPIDTLATRDYTLVMKDDCNLELIKAGRGVAWQSGTSGRGKRCFARLSHRGLLVIEDDLHRTLWSNLALREDGDYVLILQINGRAAIYGPKVWSTSSN